LIGWDEDFFGQTFIDNIQAMHDEEMTNF